MDTRRTTILGIRWRLALGPVYFLFLLLLAGFLFPPVSATEAGIGSVVVSDIRLVKDDPAVTAPAFPTSAITVRPTTVPVRPTRTPVLVTAKNAADRLKDAIPPFLFIGILAVAFVGLIAILYLLIRRGAGAHFVQKKQHHVGTATVIDAPLSLQRKHTPAPASPGPAVLFPPSLEKRFLNPVFIGEGGLARVFRAENQKTGMTVAVKVPVRFDEVTGTHFTRDIAFWQGLDHPNIIRIFSSNILPVPYIEMEYAPSTLVEKSLPLPEKDAVGMVLAIARGIAYAHAKGIVHRDIKPENILIASDGTPKITDWGLGKAISDPRLSTMIGFSPSYAAPEQIAPHRFGKPGPATDIYQLGMLLYEVLTGSVVFSGEGMHDLNMAILEDMPEISPWNGRYEARIKEIILRCLAKNPDERYASVEGLIRDLEGIQSLA